MGARAMASPSCACTDASRNRWVVMGRKQGSAPHHTLSSSRRSSRPFSLDMAFSWKDYFRDSTSNKNKNAEEEAYDSLGHQERPEEDVAFVALLKDCAKQKDLSQGSRLHAHILERGLLKKNIFIGNTLVNMYAKCAALAMAYQAFDELPVRDVVSWNVLIAGYSQHGHGEKALNCFVQMQQEGLSPNAMTFSCILKACGSIGAYERGKELHACILKAEAAQNCKELATEQSREGFVEIGTILGSALLDMYAKCGALEKAQQVFDDLRVTDVVSWTALIRGFCEHGLGERALAYFEQMKCKGLCPDTVTFACILKACGSIGAAEKGEQLHAEIVRKGLVGKDIVLESALLDMYSKCGALFKAQQVFGQLPTRDLVAWNSLVAGYTQHGHGKEALNCFEQMQSEGVSPDAVTFACILKACGSLGVCEMGKEVHAEIVRKGLLGNGTLLGNALVDMYAKCGALARAQDVFDELFVWDVVSWNALVTGYARHGQGEEALDCYERMRQEGLSPSIVTFACVLKACGSIGASEKGKELHAEIVRTGLLENGTVLGNALVDMYAKCGELAKAQQVFDELLVQDVVAWNVLITGYSEHGHGEEALNCFEQMTQEGLSPHEITFACVLKACGRIEAAEKGKEIHGEIARLGLLGNSRLLGSALVDMYVKCGVLAEAQQTFDELPVQDVVSWNALIAGHCQQGNGEEALNCFERMKCEQVSPDEVTFACALKAYGSIGAGDRGSEIHAEIVRKGLWGKNNVLGNAVVDMYAKCSLLTKAQQVFDELPARDLISWNALITGYCQHGHGKEALDCFEQMELEGISPDAATFACILKACGSIGAAEEGQMYFETMITSYGISPTIEHHTCMVYLNGLAGQFDKAMAGIKQWPFPDYLPAWFALLGACQKWGNVKLGRFAFEHAIQLDEKSAFAYLCMNSIYAAAGMQDDADEIEQMRLKSDARKNLRHCSWTLSDD